MVKRVFFLFLALWILAAPVLAVDNTIGVVQQDLNFVGLSIGDPSDIGYRSFDGKTIPKFKKTMSSVSLVGKDIYFFFEWPELADTMSVQCDLGLSTYMTGPNQDGWWGYQRTNWNDGELVYLNATENSFMGSSYNEGMRGYTMTSTIVTNDSYEYLVFKMHYTASSGSLDMDFTFSESASISGSYSGTNAASTISVATSPSSAWEIVLNVDTYSTVLYQYGEGTYRWWDPNMGIIEAYINTPFHSGSGGIKFTEAASSESGSLTLSESGSLTASTAFDIMAYGLARATYGNDGGLVDEVFDIGDTLDSIESETFDQGETLDQIAGDMSQIVEDMQAKQDAANDIGGSTSEDQISGTQESMSTGMGGLSSGLEVVQDMAIISAPSTMYINLLTATVAPMLNFGNGVLYWALFAMIIGSVILFILRRLE